MNERYYRVRKSDHPKENGIVVRLCEGKLETFAGGCDPKEYGCRIKKSELSVSEGHQFEEISARKAEKLRSDYINWVGMQTWLGVDPASLAIKEDAQFKRAGLM
jgi:hypothetical protein